MDVIGVAGPPPYLHQRHPSQRIVCLADTGRCAPELERRLFADASILGEPFTPDFSRAVVNGLVGSTTADNASEAV